MNPQDTSKLLLPVEAYTSQEWFDHEQRDIFGRTWQFAGMQTDIGDVGDFVCVNVGAYPIIVIRDESGSLKAFHNICRHRGTQLLEVRGNRKKVIQCPYHDWVYSLDGKLIGVPEKRTQFPHIDMAQWGLFPAAIAIWKEMIFVNPDPEATPFAEWVGDFEPYFGPHQPELLKEYETREYEIKANWKIFVENYIDVYHLSHLHSETLNMYDHAKLQSVFTSAGHTATYDPPTKDYRKYLESNPSDYLPLIDHVKQEQWGAYTHMMFPCFGIAGDEFNWSTLEVIPVSPTVTKIRQRSRTMPMDDMTVAIGKGYEKVSNWFYKQMGYQPEDNPLDSKDFMLEDIYACEQQQKAMASPQFAFGPTSIDQEQLIVDFHRTVLSYMQG